LDCHVTAITYYSHSSVFKVTLHKSACINLLLITIFKNHLHSKYSVSIFTSVLSFLWIHARLCKFT
jgi:hypothetical protein